MRLDKYIKHSLCISRSEAINLIKNKQILVNGIAKNKDYDVTDLDIVTYNGSKIIYKEFYYYMLNKPAGYISSTVEKEGMPVTNLIKERNDLFPVGRLDKDTEGLLILTNDGDLAHRLTSPRHEVEKKYYVETREDVEKKDIDLFERGIEINLDGSTYKCLPARLEIIAKNKCYVFIKEGKFRQVKEMFKSLNNKVTYLKRVAMGELVLDNNLKSGEYRELAEDEIAYLKSVK